MQVFLTEASHRMCLSKSEGGNAAARGQPGVWGVVGAYVTYFFGYVVLSMLVVVLKLTTGQLRPHFLAVCQPDPDPALCSGSGNDFSF